MLGVVCTLPLSLSHSKPAKPPRKQQSAVYIWVPLPDIHSHPPPPHRRSRRRVSHPPRRPSKPPPPLHNRQDIGGYDIQKQEIREAVELPLTQGDLYRQLGIDPPRCARVELGRRVDWAAC
jgi:hypothetical protein